MDKECLNHFCNRDAEPGSRFCKEHSINFSATHSLFEGDGLVLDNINVMGEGPVRFRNKSDLKRYCQKHGLESGALL